MSRLPEPGKDNGEWGDILNDFLLQSLATDGSLKIASINESKFDNATRAKLNASSGVIADESVTTQMLANNSVTVAKLAPNVVSTAGRTGSYADLTGKPTIPTTPEQVAAEPAGLSAATLTTLNNTYVTPDQVTAAVEPKANATSVYSKTDADARFSPLGQGLTPFYFGSVATSPRPASSSAVLWIGSVTPLNIAAGDIYFHSTAVTPATVYLSDTFDRADGVVGPSPTGGITPTAAPIGTLAIIDNKIGWSDLASGTAYATWDTGHSDGVYKITLDTMEATSGMGIVFRYSSATSHLLLVRVSSTARNWRLVKRAGSTAAVELAGPTTTPAAPVVPMASGDVIEATLNGSAVTVKINGTVFYSGTVTDVMTNTRVGFSGTNPSVAGATKFDNVSFTALS